MKKVLFVLTLLFVGPLSVKPQAESKEPSKGNNYFYVSPINLFLSTLELGYERKLACHNTFVVLGAVKLSKKDNYFDRTGGSGELQYRVNLHYNKEAANSITRNFSTFAYFAPYVLYRYEQINDSYMTDAITTVESITMVNSGFAGVGFGMRLTANESRFCVNLFAGGGLKYSDINGKSREDGFLQVGYTGIAPKLSFQMGIAF